MLGASGEVLPAMEKTGEVEAWIVDDTGFAKKGTHSVGVARQYCGQLGKQDNCRVAVSVSVATATSSLPIAWRLYLPEIWAKDVSGERRRAFRPKSRFETKPQIALEQIRKAFEQACLQPLCWPTQAMGMTAGSEKGSPNWG